jgi:two-component system cell cycle sensor histidine kinase PleC
MDKQSIDQAELDRKVRFEQLTAGGSQALFVMVATPFWSLLIAYACSGAFPVLGVVSVENLTVWVLLVTATCLVGIVQSVLAHRKLTATPGVDPGPFQRASYALTCVVNAAWSSCFWFLWEDGNAVNHLFLTVLILCATVNAVVARGGNFLRYLSAIVPIFLLVQSKWMTGESELAALYIVMTPLWTLWISLQMRNIFQQAEAATWARFEKEALAEALIHARDEAERSRKYAEHANATKTAFLANMSHELRTPLNAILGFSEIINTEALGPSAREKYKDYAGDILTSGKHLLSLINDLLDIAKIEAGKLEVSPQWVDASRAVRECVHLMETRASDGGVKLSWTVAADAPRLFADERALRQILFNLVSNAIKFTPQHGRVEVRVVRQHDFAVLTVEDTGCGIPKEQIDRVFLPFEQIDNRYAATAGGTGLGLTLVRALTELHGGTCDLESDAGQGTQVHVRFPLPKAPALVGPSVSGNAAVAPFHARPAAGQAS